MATSTESAWADQSAFDYDYETVQTTGLILAVVMFVSGILIALSRVLWNGFRPPKQRFPHSQYRDYAFGEEHQKSCMGSVGFEGFSVSFVGHVRVCSGFLL
ncbi:FXYD domain containing ion transport regulator 7 isoform X1 [Silurus meridionalis]|uniref:FXYD domain containing ion transport regulator 7 isoform X1 n=1 Tax=Silurus meridionalis TaxID=175797 RepID=UPI001EECB581|nr:FXYD domain containing ion transport regulator 7 isoform X1 [Silurus meridionalis]KAI5105821.1 FXYD domain containing ion transport regulator 7-like isoform 1 [Silurus meridionalis]